MATSIRREPAFAFRMPQQNEYAMTVGIRVDRKDETVIYCDLTAEEAGKFAAEMLATLAGRDPVAAIADAICMWDGSVVRWNQEDTDRDIDLAKAVLKALNVTTWGRGEAPTAPVNESPFRVPSGGRCTCHGAAGSFGCEVHGDA